MAAGGYTCLTPATDRTGTTPSLWSASENLCYGKHGGKCLNLKKHYVKPRMGTHSAHLKKQQNYEQNE